ncbi:hypothetical protein H9X87_08930 [Pseudoflavonifractor capillosus]|uniref:hypothetical protein n=1 Tax=Pseudoflavonifractor capillosus TaxID=106588 RepID=UPI00195C9AAF|nr:hypothetical protein [Pseudoflavonifractor capillosus]MBM6694879.1 hypothetical protein [Pseudoflavonifractor capillosus]
MAAEQNDNIFSGLVKKNVIKTENLFISGHLLQWEDVIIQISNISLISTANWQQTPFPVLAILLVFAGLFLITIQVLLALLCIALGLVWVYLWYLEQQKTKDYKYLNIYLNSGRVFSLLFENTLFLDQVMKIFADIFEKGGDSVSGGIHIDIKNCTVDHQASLIGTIYEANK